MDIYYSQHGEDFLVNKIFNDTKTGVFVEIGCLDGIEYSNTFYFEKKGWKGVCIEAHTDFIPLLVKNRPGSTIVHCAIGAEDKEKVIFYANKIGSLSTLDKSEEDRWKKDYNQYFTGFEEQIVQMRTLTSVFDELKLDNIDFVSLDIEGYEVQALMGLDFTKYKPKVFIIEFKNLEHKIKIEQILFNCGYSYLGIIGCNLFYSTKKSDKEFLNQDYGKVPLKLVDNKGEEHDHEVVFRKINWLNKAINSTAVGKIKSILKRSFLWKIYKKSAK